MPDTENKWTFTEVGWRSDIGHYRRLVGGMYLIETTQEIGGSTVHARFAVDSRWLDAIEKPVDAR